MMNTNESDRPGTPGGEGPPDPPIGEEGRPPANGTDCLAALQSDVAGLEEVCRWQWNLIQRLKGHMEAFSGQRSAKKPPAIG
jgi:hypothetical protein